MSANLLELQSVSKQFGGLKAIDGVSFALSKGGLFGLIGPNGAGKTTMFNVMTGVYTPSAGSIFFNGESIGGIKPNQIARKGIGRTFQNIRLFKDMSVIENVLVGCAAKSDCGFVATLLQLESFRIEEKKRRDEAIALLDFFGLADKKDWAATSLPYGEQRKLEIARALAGHPQLLCLDEPAAGMNHQETDRLMDMIQALRKNFSLTVLLIEHDMKLVMSICERIIVLDHGAKIAEGAPKEIQCNDKVIEAYLGPQTEEAHP